jgi:orotate phosphoribosyltransferase
MDYRLQLINDINKYAVKKGDFTLASGKKSSYYIDLRKVTLRANSSKLIGKLMLSLFEKNNIVNIDAVGGLTLGADPVATAIMHNSKNINSFVVRKKPKIHGVKNQIEGPDIKGKNVVIVEDTSTTGESAKQAVDVAIKKGANILAVAVIVDRNTGAKEFVENLGFNYLYLFSVNDLTV